MRPAGGIMANPAAVVQRPHVPAAMLRRRRRANRRRAQLIANAAVFLLSTAGSIVIYYGAANSGGHNGSRAGDDPAYALPAFLLSLLGIWLVLLALVADRFPAVATIGEAIAKMALRGYFGGGGRRN